MYVFRFLGGEVEFSEVCNLLNHAIPHSNFFALEGEDFSDLVFTTRVLLYYGAHLLFDVFISLLPLPLFPKTRNSQSNSFFILFLHTRTDFFVSYKKSPNLISNMFRYPEGRVSTTQFPRKRGLPLSM